jgi:cobalt-zinc-cadmium efflux system membrane fusion protein
MNILSLYLSRLGAVIVVGVAAACMVGAVVWVRSNAKSAGEQTTDEDNGTRLVGNSYTIEIPTELARSWRIHPQQASLASSPRPLPVLSGSLGLDVTKLAPIRSRFPGEVMEIGTFPCDDQGNPVKGARELKVGDRVEAGQLVAVVWCKDLGEKKSELVSAISQLKLSEETYKRNEPLLRQGSISETRLQELAQAVELNLVAVVRAEQTLRTWLVPEEEIQKVRQEADKILKRDFKPDPNWARVEVRAKFAGTILERNVAFKGGAIIDTTMDLFKIVDLSELVVMAHIYEDDLPALLALPRPIRWKIRVRADDSGKVYDCTIDTINKTIDPNTHTALLTGFIDNKDGRLLAGQFISATINRPPAANEMEIQTAALVDEHYVFVQPDLNKAVYSLRRVQRMPHRPPSDSVAFVRLPAADERPGANDPPLLRPGDNVVNAGSQSLKTALDGLTPKAVGAHHGE